MNDRVQIAAMAMQGMLACPDRDGSASDYAADALKMADALLAKAGESADCCKAAIADLESRADNVEAEMRDMIRDCDAQIARLKAELERVTAPLTEDDCHHVNLEMRTSNNENTRRWDRAITAVKMGRGK